MNKSKQLKALVQTTFAAVIAATVIGGLASTLYFAEQISAAPPPNTDSASSQTNSVEAKAGSPDTNKVVVKRKLTGAELYSIHCNRCHAERYPTERTGAQWKTIMLHMRVRANLPAEDARTILKFLQENSGR